MLDLAPSLVMQRVEGAARVRFGPGLKDLYQQGSAKVMLPNVEGWPEVVFLNTAGGLTSGDRLSYHLQLDAGAAVVATTQTAERAYHAKSQPAEVSLRFDLGETSRLHWLPQETILYDSSALLRTTEVHLAKGAEVLMAEVLVFGRLAMGETLSRLAFTDRRDIWREGRLIHREALDAGRALQHWQNGVVLGDARAMASLVLTGRDLEAALPALRALHEDGVTCAASAFDGRLTLRALAPDLFPLKRLIARAITTLTKAPLPRVWQI